MTLITRWYHVTPESNIRARPSTGVGTIPALGAVLCRGHTMQAVLRINGYDSFEQIAVGGMARRLQGTQAINQEDRRDQGAACRARPTALHHALPAGKPKRPRVQHDNIVNVIDYGKFGRLVLHRHGVLRRTHHRRAPAHAAAPSPLDIAPRSCSTWPTARAAHGENLVHRDIKPANIIFTRAGRDQDRRFRPRQGRRQIQFRDAPPARWWERLGVHVA